MTDYAYLEIGLRRRDAEHYALKLCFVRPTGEASNQVVSTSATTQFDIAALDRWGDTALAMVSCWSKARLPMHNCRLLSTRPAAWPRLKIRSE